MATNLSSSYELFLPRGTLSRAKSLSKRLNAIQVFRDAIEKVHPQMKDDFIGTRKWIVVIIQPCLHKSSNSPKNRLRTYRSTAAQNGKTTASEHYTAYGYLAAPTSSQSKKGEVLYVNRWWMHVDAAKHADYGPHPQRGKMWRKIASDREIVPLAGPFKI